MIAAGMSAHRSRGNLRAAKSASASAAAVSPRNVTEDQNAGCSVAREFKARNAGTLPRVATSSAIAASSNTGSAHTAGCRNGSVPSPPDSDQRNAFPRINGVVSGQFSEPPRPCDNDIPRPRRADPPVTHRQCDGLPGADLLRCLPHLGASSALYAALSPADERQGRAIDPDALARVGLPSTLSELGAPHDRSRPVSALL